MLLCRNKLFIIKLKYIKKILKRALIGISLAIMLVGCGVVKKQQAKNDYPLGTSMMLTCDIQNGKAFIIESI